jgi:hypothetical protein
MPSYQDLYKLPEDDRIRLMGHYVMDHGLTISCIVDDEPDKPERYIRKFKARFPGIQVLEQFKGPVKGTITIKLGPPANAKS